MSWIPLIGLVCPDESILFKKLLDTYYCSSNEEAQFIEDNDHVNYSHSVQEIQPVEIGEGDHANIQEAQRIDPIDNTIKRLSSEGEHVSHISKNEDTLKEIFNNSLVLEKVLEQWKNALNKRAEIIAKRAEVKKL